MQTRTPIRAERAARAESAMEMEIESFRRASASVGFEEPRLARLENARGQLWEAIRAPGLEGQTGLFGRLQDLQDALEEVQRDADFVARHRGDIVRSIRSCQETLQRMERVFTFLEGLIEERVGQASVSAYGDPRKGRGNFRPLGAGSAGNWEA